MKKFIHALIIGLFIPCILEVNAAPANTAQKEVKEELQPKNLSLPTLPAHMVEEITDELKTFEIPQAKELSVPTKGFEGENVSVLDTLNALAHIAGINYVAPNVPKVIQTKEGNIPHPLYADTITFSLGDLEPMQAFNFIAKNKGYSVHEDNGIYYLTHPKLDEVQVYTTETYIIKNIDARWMLEPVASLLGISLAQAGGPNGYGAMPDSNPAYPKSKEEGKNSGSNSGSGSSGSRSSGSGDDVSEDYTKFQTGELNARYMPALPLAQPIYVGGYNGGASIFVNRITNTLVVRATASEHAAVKDFLKQNDIAEAQIQIDIKFIELEVKDRTQEGIDWSATLGNATFSMAPVTVDLAALPNGVGNSTSWIFNPSAVILNYPTAQATLKFLQTQKNAILSSSPRIVTKSGVPAAIEATTLESIEVYTLVNTSGYSTPVTSGTEQFATGVFMDIIATLTPSGHLQLNMNPTVSNKVGETIGSSGQVLPIISKRKATTTVTIAPSQTVVIGGLMRGGETYSDDKVPILSDIPYIGNLFKSADNEKVKTSLLIFVTASLVNAVYETPPSEEEFELLQREQALRDRVDYKDKYGKGAKTLTELYDEYMLNKRNEKEGAAKGKIDHNTANLPTLSETELKSAEKLPVAEETPQEEPVYTSDTTEKEDTVSDDKHDTETIPEAKEEPLPETAETIIEAISAESSGEQNANEVNNCYE